MSNTSNIPDPSLTLAEISRLCGAGIPMPQASDHGRVFAEPWQAHAFAMTLQLHERGLDILWREDGWLGFSDDIHKHPLVEETKGAAEEVYA